MDAFLFPSETDTFGNVVLEAAASGVPSIVSAHGGPKFLVEPGVTGFVAGDIEEYAAGVAALLRDRPLRDRMAKAAREQVLRRQWSAVFELVYREYGRAVLDGTIPSVAVNKTFLTLPVS
jgi:glycosyltransferase involved in cell wall biosynthesis